MTLIEDARRLLDGPAPTYWDQEYSGRVNEYGVQESGSVLMCAHCRRKIHDHRTDCPWLAMPRIVAALEAAQRMAELLDDSLYYVDHASTTKTDADAMLQEWSALADA